MSCLHPVYLKGLTDAAGFPIRSVPCGKCIECLKAKRREWFFRNRAQLLSSSSAYFVTLTFDDEHLPRPDDNGKVIFQKFLKRLRKNRSEKLSYFAVNETGDDFDRLHFHMLLYNLEVPEVCIDPLGYVEEVISKAWQQGFISVGKVEDASINYVCKYCLKKIQEDTRGFFTCYVRGDQPLGLDGLQLPENLPCLLNVMVCLASPAAFQKSYLVTTLKKSSEIVKAKIEYNLQLTPDTSMIDDKIYNVVKTFKTGSNALASCQKQALRIIRRMISKGYIKMSINFSSLP